MPTLVFIQLQFWIGFANCLVSLLPIIFIFSLSVVLLDRVYMGIPEHVDIFFNSTELSTIEVRTSPPKKKKKKKWIQWNPTWVTTLLLKDHLNETFPFMFLCKWTHDLRSPFFFFRRPNDFCLNFSVVVKEVLHCGIEFLFSHQWGMVWY